MGTYDLKYECSSTYVDIDTGEIIKRGDVYNTGKYMIVKTIKEIKTCYNGKADRTIKYTIKCRRNNQGTLW